MGLREVQLPPHCCPTRRAAVGVTVDDIEMAVAHASHLALLAHVWQAVSQLDGSRRSLGVRGGEAAVVGEEVAE